MQKCWSWSRVSDLVKEVGAVVRFREKQTIDETLVTKQIHSSDYVKVTVCDGSSEAGLTLWDVVTPSAAQWKPSHTVLLITNPGLKPHDRKIQLSLNTSTFVDVDPDLSGAEWLRTYVGGLVKRNHVNPPFPDSQYALLLYSSILILSQPLTPRHSRRRTCECYILWLL